MLPLYLFCLIIGGGLLLFSIFGSEVEGHDVDGDVDGTMAHEFFSVRALSYLLAGFGGTGFLVGTLTEAGSFVTLVWALVTGMVAALSAGLVYGWLRRSESGMMVMTPEHFAGLAAEVILPVTPQHRGKVLTTYEGRQVELLARLYGTADPECPRGSTVVIVEMDGETALVTPAGFLPS